MSSQSSSQEQGYAYHLIDELGMTLNADDQGIMLSDLPKMFLMGGRRTGKTSMERVVFHKLQAHETQHLESTNEIRVKEIRHNPILQFQILDFPGGWEAENNYTPEHLFVHCDVLVFVIDAQDPPFDTAIKYIVEMIQKAVKAKRDIKINILINKVDNDAGFFTEQQRSELRNQISNSIEEQLDRELSAHLSFYMCSIYDNSVFEAFSKIQQQILVPETLSFLENMLDSLVQYQSNQHITKAYLFDVTSKTYLATDSNPSDLNAPSLCSDAIDVQLDISGIYGHLNIFDEESCAVIQLSDNRGLILREMGSYIVLVCLVQFTGTDDELSLGLAQHNFSSFKSSFAKALQVLKINE
jgi:Ras-related GTP-binding protein C/D